MSVRKGVSKLPSEKRFEGEIENYMTSPKGGWTKGSSANFNPGLALDPVELMAWIKDTQSDKLQELRNRRNNDVEQKFIERVAQELDNRGTLDVLRHGVTDLGVEFQMCQFKPAGALNPDLVELYQKNRLTVTRQVHFSTTTNESIDMCLFVNGIPVATAELKELLTGQNVKDAIIQYKARDNKEKLFNFKTRALVHFAVDPNDVYMTTRLSGDKTHFLPFNKGNNGGAGNPENPHGYKTAYLWERIWQKDVWLNVVANYIHLEKKKKKRGDKFIDSETMIFPRYHQLDAVVKMLDSSKVNGPGHNYLIQHSAGSGKSITIGWLAHQLCRLHDEEGQNLIYDSVIIVTDRLILDRQLQDTVYQIEHARGVVKKIDRDSKQLARALEKGTKIIITTLQKFPFVLDHISEKLPSRKYAIIIDEAHSSQSGETARELRKVLDPDLQESEDEEFDVELALVRQIRSRKVRTPNLSYYAFTATPRYETVGLFGTTNADGVSRPFHIYSMKQAIEEGFILDVLQNYTTYSTYYKVMQKAQDDPSVEKRKAARAMARFVQLHPYNLAQKTEVIIEHFRNNTMKKIKGRAKSMVVTSSRKHAKRYKDAFDKYLKEKDYKGIGVLVAFSGEVEDGGQKFTEKNMNDLRGQDIRDVFNTDEYNVLLVAEKFQTGFDQPLLHSMYVDKKLQGLRAVQTLSRLNRIHPDKEDTFILDFVNDPEEIQKAFAVYYEDAMIPGEIDPNVLYDFRAKMDSADVYRWSEIEQFVEIMLEKRSQGQAHKILDQAVERFEHLDEEEQEEFISNLTSYLRAYSFLGQVLPYEDLELEKLYIYCRMLKCKLPRPGSTITYDIGKDIDLEYYRLTKVFEGKIGLEYGKPIATPGFSGKMATDDDITSLSKVVEEFNKRFGTQFSEGDKVADLFEESILVEENLREGAQVNTIDAFEVIFDEVFDNKIFEVRSKSQEFFDLLVENEEAREYWRKFLLERVYKKLRSEQ